eukprot:g15360.t1
MWADPVFRSDREVMLQAVRYHGTLLRCASEDLRHDREVVYQAILGHGYALSYASTPLRADPLLLRLSSRPHCHIPIRLEDEKIVYIEDCSRTMAPANLKSSDYYEVLGEGLQGGDSGAGVSPEQAQMFFNLFGGGRPSQGTTRVVFSGPGGESMDVDGINLSDIFMSMGLGGMGMGGMNGMGGLGGMGGMNGMGGMSGMGSMGGMGGLGGMGSFGGMGGMGQAHRASSRTYGTIKAGEMVIVHSLNKAKERLGDQGDTCGTSRAEHSGGLQLHARCRYEIRLEDGPVIHVRPENITQQSTVTIHGLNSKPELNGKTAQIVSFDPATKRYVVLVNAGSAAPANLHAALGCSHGIVNGAAVHDALGLGAFAASAAPHQLALQLALRWLLPNPTFPPGPAQLQERPCSDE